VNYMDSGHSFNYAFVQDGERKLISLGSWWPPGRRPGSFLLYVTEDRQQAEIIRASLLAGEFPFS
jgi:hypothetical protein